jgi:hypothetical protein
MTTAASMSGVNRDALPILTESPRRHVIAASHDRPPVVPPISVAFVGHRWRVRHVNGGVVHAASGLVRVPRVDSMVHTWRGGMSRGVRPLPGYL